MKRFIILDSNVISELMKDVAEEAVFNWANNQDPDRLTTTTITKAEIGSGIMRLKDGKKKTMLLEAAYDIFDGFYGGKMFTFDESSAVIYARLTAERFLLGKPLPQMDALIASICIAHNCILATRNTKDFEGLGIELINPWEYQG